RVLLLFVEEICCIVECVDIVGCRSHGIEPIAQLGGPEDTADIGEQRDERRKFCFGWGRWVFEQWTECTIGTFCVAGVEELSNVVHCRVSVARYDQRAPERGAPMSRILLVCVAVAAMVAGCASSTSSLTRGDTEVYTVRLEDTNVRCASQRTPDSGGLTQARADEAPRDSSHSTTRGQALSVASSSAVVWRGVRLSSWAPRSSRYRAMERCPARHANWNARSRST